MIIKNIIFYLFLLLFSLDNIYTQHYIWPTEASKTVTGVFGDYRPRRYHAGIDIRTYGVNGKKIYAIDAGYIERVRTSSSGYGKAIYIRLKNGDQALYAHLSDFPQNLKETVKSLQSFHKKYEIDHSFEPNSYPVKRGEVIGYTGDTGTISGPHLHFEIRDKNGNPKNPFLTNLKITDTSLPQVDSLAFIPLSDSTLINGYNFTQKFPLKKVSICKDIVTGGKLNYYTKIDCKENSGLWEQDNKNYQLEDTVSINGLFGIAINAFDKIDYQPFNYGLYNIEFSLDDKILYDVKYDNFSLIDVGWVNDDNFILFEKDYSLKKLTNKNYTRLFNSGYIELPEFIKSDSSKIILSTGYHDFEIEINDYNNNYIWVKGILTNAPHPNIKHISLNSSKSGINLINIDSNEELDLQLFYTTAFPDENELLKPLNAEKLSNARYRFKYLNDFFPVIKLIGKNKNGQKILPQYINLNNTNPLEIPGDFKLLHYEHGIIVQYKEKKFSGKEATIVIENNITSNSYKMKRVSKCLLSSETIAPSQLYNIESISIVYKSKPDIVNKFEIGGMVFYPGQCQNNCTNCEDCLGYSCNNKSDFNCNKMKNDTKCCHWEYQNFNYFNKNLNIKISGDNSTFFDTTFVWVKPEKTPFLKHGEYTVNPIFIGPTLVPYRNPLQIEFYLPKNKPLDKTNSIYYFDAAKERWIFMNSDIDTIKNTISTNILSGEIFAVINETIPPNIITLIPDVGGSYNQNSLKKITFKIDDNLSGILNENNIALSVDNNPMIFEYNSYRKEIILELENTLSIGKHLISIDVSDNAGNHKLKSGNFYIIP